MIGRHLHTATTASATAVLVLLLALPASLRGQHEEPPRPSAYALTGVTVVHADGRRDADVTVVVRGPRIESMGAGVAVPPDARVLDGDSLRVYPGLVDAWGEADLELPTVDRSEELPWAPSREARGFTPGRTLPDVLSATGAGTRSQRRAGVVAAGVVPGAGFAPGQLGVVLFRPGADLPRELVVHPSLGPVLTFEGARGVYPGTLFAVIASIRQAFEDALHQGRVRARYASDPGDVPVPAHDPDLVALRRAAEGEVPVFFVASEDEDVRRALSLSDEYGFRLILVGGMEAWELADELRRRDVPVLASLDFPDPEEWDPDADAATEADPDDPEQPGRREEAGAPEEGVLGVDPQEPTPGALRERERLQDLYSNAGRLAAAGVRVALTSGGGEADLLEGARRTVEYGLPEEEALRALTATPAEILGIGSMARLAPRSSATFVVTDGALLAEGTRVVYTFVEGGLERGREAPEAAGEGEEPTVDVTGRWTLELAPAQASPITLELRQEGAIVTGTASGPTGEGSVEGSVSGNRITLRFEVPGEDFSLDASGTVEDDEIEGTVEGPGGEEIDFEARRTGPPPSAAAAPRSLRSGGGR